MDEGWRSFREAVRQVGRAKMDEPAASGWAIGVAGSNTYGDSEEHATELGLE